MSEQTTAQRHHAPLQEMVSDEDIPEEARVVARILLSMGVTECEPRVLNQLLEFMHSYTAQILADSAVYADHAGRSEMEVEDLQFAVKAHAETQHPGPPSVELLLGVARQTNALRLPSIPKKFGLFLPPDPLCLTEINYQIEPSGKPSLDSTPPSSPTELTLPDTELLLLNPPQNTQPKQPRISVMLKDLPS